MAILADFMLVWLPAPTVSLRAPLTVSAGPLAKYFHGCPENAFQVPVYFLDYLFFNVQNFVLFPLHMTLIVN